MQVRVCTRKHFVGGRPYSQVCRMGSEGVCTVFAGKFGWVLGKGFGK